MTVQPEPRSGYMGYPNAHTLTPAIRALAGVGIVLSTVFTAARLVTKRLYSSYHTEDYLSMAAWLAANSYFAVVLVQTDVGLGEHVWQVNPRTSTRQAKLGYVLEIDYSITLAVAKCALLFQLQRIFAPTKVGVIYIATQALIWVNCAAYMACLFAIIFQCTPIRKVWTPTMTTGHCISFDTILITSGAINIATDMLILVLPIWAIYRLRMPLQKKFAASAMFATGGLSFASSICREIYSIIMGDSQDVTYDLAKTVLWAFGEIISIILCTCLPLMPRFIKMVTSKHETSSLGGWLSGRHTIKTSNSRGGSLVNLKNRYCACQAGNVFRGPCRCKRDGELGRDGELSTIGRDQSSMESGRKEAEEGTPVGQTRSDGITVQREFQVMHGVTCQ